MTKGLVYAGSFMLAMLLAPSPSQAKDTCTYQNREYPAYSTICVGRIKKECRRGAFNRYRWTESGRCPDPRRPNPFVKPRVTPPVRIDARPAPGRVQPGCLWAGRRYAITASVCAIGGNLMRCVANNNWRRVAACKPRELVRGKTKGIAHVKIPSRPAHTCKHQGRYYPEYSIICVARKQKECRRGVMNTYLWRNIGSSCPDPRLQTPTVRPKR